ncbi:MAG: hypothetical protein IJO32_02570 [Bacilli bacterium]|nr:hypothetical protein [Bacilli bacterium]
MNDLKKRLLSLTIAGFMIGTSGCSKNDDRVRYEVNSETNQSELVDWLTLKELEDYYIIEVNDFENQKQYYLTKQSVTTHNYQIDEYIYKIIGSDVILANRKINSKKYTCNYGEVINEVNFIQYIQKYSTIKGSYDAKEINEIYNKIVEENKAKKVKTYTKK